MRRSTTLHATSSPGPGPLGRIAAWCYRRRKRVLVFWIVLLVGAATVVAQLVGTRFLRTRSPPGTPPLNRRSTSCSRAFPADAGDSAQVVFQGRRPLTTASNRWRHRGARPEAPVRTRRGVGLVSPFAPGGAYQISRDGHIGYLMVNFTTTSVRLPASAVQRVIDVAKASAHPGLKIAAGGAPISTVVAAAPGPAEGIGVTAAIFIMLIAFGSVVAMGLPIVVALVGLAIGIGFEELGTHLLVIPTFSPELAVMMGLGVGIDYSLLIVTRYRQCLAEGLEPEAAVVAALSTSGRAGADCRQHGGRLPARPVPDRAALHDRAFGGSHRLGAARVDRIAHAAAGDAWVRRPLDRAVLGPTFVETFPGCVRSGLLVPVEPDDPAAPVAPALGSVATLVLLALPDVLHAPRLQRRRQRPGVAHHPAGLRPAGPGLRARVQRPAGDRRRARSARPRTRS